MDDDSDTRLHLSRVGDVIVFSAPSLAMPASLSASERAIARAVVAGSSNAEIGAARGTSAKTVANQLYAIYRKLGVHTREELVAKVVSEATPSSSTDAKPPVAPVNADDHPRS